MQLWGGLDKSIVFVVVGAGVGLILWYSVVSRSRYEESGLTDSIPLYCLGLTLFNFPQILFALFL